MTPQDRIEDIYPLTPLQKGILFHALYSPEAALYFEQLLCRLDGTIEPAAFSAAWQELVARHAILRTAFVVKGQREPVQVVFRRLDFLPTVEDWSGLLPPAQKERLAAFLESDRRRGFAFNKPPLMRVLLAMLGANTWQFVWSHHHLLLDGWCLPILMREFFALLAARQGGAAPQLPDPRPFGDYLAWLKQQDAARTEAFWRRNLDGFTAPTALGFGKAPEAGAAAPGRMAEARFAFEESETAQWNVAARAARVTPGVFCQGAWALVLGRYSGSDDVLFGITVSGRPATLAGAEEMVGLFINTLPARVRIDGSAPVALWLQALQTEQLALREFEHSSLTDVQGWSEVPRGQPLFESLFVFENFPVDRSLQTEHFGLRVSEAVLHEQTNFPLTLVLVPGERLQMKIGFDAARFSSDEIARLFAAYREVVRAMSGGPARPLGSIGLLPPAAPGFEGALPGAALEKPGRGSLAEWFCGSARRHALRVAVTDGGQALTYDAIDRAANQLAHELCALGVTPGRRVGICLPRSADLVVAMLAVVKAGGTYVPLDPDYPSDRLDYMATDSGAAVVITKDAWRERFLAPEAPRLCLDDPATVARLARRLVTPPDVTVHPGQAAYVIYTSGSTGRPKGVLVTHRNVTRLFAATEDWFRFDERDVWTFFHSFAFDFSVWEIWGALLYGGRLVVVPYLVSRNPEAFHALLADERVTVLNQTPSAFRSLIAVEEAAAAPAPLALRTVIFGGEALDLAMLRPWFSRHGDRAPELVNMYGITETTVHVTYRPLRRADAEAGRGSVIGAAIPDLSLHILDHYGHPLPAGVAGEIHVGGAGLARGYLGRPDLTAERFIPHALAGGRLYRSGDLARRLPDGDVEYLGRIDHQVKIRGFRIELGEIEAALALHPAVAARLVLVCGERADGRQLAAYLVMRAGLPRPGVEELRGFLRMRLPDYMVPAHFVVLEKFPLTANGKIDRRALPAPDASREQLGAPYAPPVTSVEIALAAVWAEALGVDRVGLHDNFFSLGGDSIRSLRVRSLAQDRGLHFTLPQLFSAQTVARLAPLAANAPAERAGASPSEEPFALVPAADRGRLPAGLADAYPLSQLQAGMLFHADFGEGRVLYQDLFMFRLRMPYDGETLERIIGTLVQNHPVLRTSFHFDEFSMPLQFVHETAAMPVEFADLRSLAPEAREAALERWMQTAHAQGFDTARAPLGRLMIHRLAEDIVQVSVHFHHAILDGWSVATLMAEFAQRYLHALGRGVPAAGEPPANSFRRFVALERAAIDSDATRAFWQAQQADAPFTRVPRWPGKTTTLAAAGPSVKIDQTCPAELSQRLHSVAARAGVPVKAVLLAVHLRVLAQLTGEREIVSGLVANGRPEDRDGARALGLFLNTLPLRLEVPGGSWLALVRATHAAEQALFAHRHFPMAELQRLRGGQPLFETSFNFVQFHVYENLRGLRDLEIVDVRSFEEIEIPFAVSFNAGVGTPDIRYSLWCDRRLFPEEQVRHAAALYLRALGALAADPGACHDDAPWLDASERSELLAARNATRTAPPAVACVHRVIEEQARRTPDAPAVACEDAVWSYATLNRRANAAARRLIAAGVGPDEPVAVFLERAPALVAALLGVLKAGGAYAPVDPDYPAGRIVDIVEGGGLRYLATSAGLRSRLPELPGVTVVEIDPEPPIAAADDDNPAPALTGANLAYLLFTSGSTGRPKGVAIPHAALANHMEWFQETFGLTPADIVFQKTPFTFDAAVWEFWAPLMTGGRLLLATPGGQRDPAYLVAEIRRAGVTVLQLVPTLLEALLVEPGLAGCRSLRWVFSGGEALNGSVRQRFAAVLQAPLVNLYGPTETTIDCAYWESSDADTGATVPIGRPVDNTRLYVLDARLNPVPLGAPGELYVAGAQLARGYHGQPDLTAERFLPDPFGGEPGGRLYRTGDWVRHLPGEGIEYLGRIDDQVKVRGFRIELGEVESALAACPGVVRAAASVREGRLVGYYEWPAAPGDAAAALRARLAARLPDYMVPALFAAVAQWPLLPSGKVNRRALPAPAGPETVHSRPVVAPRDATETTLAEIWSQVLGLPRVSVDDSFFELGGDSILSLQIVARARRAGLQFALRDLFQHRTIASLARRVREAAPEPAVEDVRIGAVPLTPIQRWFFEQPLVRPDHWNQAVLLSLDPAVGAGNAQSALGNLVALHDAFQLRFERAEEGWRQHYGDAAGSWLFEEANLSDCTASELPGRLEARAAVAQASLDLVRGPLVRAVYFRLGEGERPRLLLVIHHLAVDGVSWRALLQEFAAELNRLQEARLPVSSPPVWTFSRWAKQLAASVERIDASERAYWLAEAAAPAPAQLPLDFPEGRTGNSGAAVQTVTVELDARATECFLRTAPAALRAEFNEILLAALADALCAWMEPGATAAVALEGHGRDALGEEAEIAQTVGWFTTLFPVRLPTGDRLSPDARLDRVRTAMRRLPRDGAGYGVLRYLAGDAATREALARAPWPEVTFNYLGQFDGSFSPGAPFAPASEPTGPANDPASARPHLLDIVALVTGGRLSIRWIYSAKAHRRDTIEKLANTFVAALESYLELARTPRAAPWRPADFPLAALDEDALAKALAGAGDVDDIYPLSPVQEGMLFHARCEPGAGLYVQQVSGRVRGVVDPVAMARAWQHAVDRHAGLRVSFVWAELAQPLQRVHRDARLGFRTEDWTQSAAAEQEARWEELLRRDRAEGFDLGRAPLLSVALVRLGPAEYRFLWTHHHLLLDGWSMPVVFRDVLAAYRAFAAGGQPVAEKAFSPRDYIAWLQRGQPAAAERFWRGHLAGFREPTVPALPRAQPGVPAGPARELDCELPAATVDQLAAFARSHDVTLNTVAQAAWAWLLSRYSGSDDVVFGVTVAGRPLELEGVESAVGLFINTLPFRATIDPAQPVGDWLRALRDRQAEINRHDFSRLVDVQGWSEAPRGRPLFETILVYENYPVAAALQDASGGLVIDELQAREQNNYPLTLYVLPGRPFTLRFAYLPEHFAAHGLRLLMKRFARVLAALADGSVRRVGELGILAPGELAEFAPQLAGPRRAVPADACVPARIAAQAVLAPERVAVAAEDGELTYAELERRSNQLAHRLVSLGVGPDVLVPVCVERTSRLPVALLGVLKAGGCYVPIDPAFPRDRLALMLDDLPSPVLVTESALVERLPAWPAATLRLDAAQTELDAGPTSAPASAAVHPEQLAYMIFTSGSTGRPKGVQIAHGALANVLQSFAREPGFSANDVLLAVTTLSFDISGLEIYLPLITGGRVALASRATAGDGFRLAAFSQRTGATVMQATPATWRVLLAAEWQPPPGFRVWCGGEALPVDLATALLERGVELWNVYGPTETTIWSTVQRVAVPADAASIGRPIDNTTAAVVDAAGHLLPAGLPGELCLGGEGVARGYFLQPGLTAEKFAPDPWALRAGARLYRTGDLARWREDGRLEYLGRLDFQVKIRGFRIELGDIEAALAGLPAIAQAVVVARPDARGVQALAAYLVARGPGAPPTLAELREHLGARLPDYMVPSAWMFLEALPLTPNGKVDRRALPAPEQARGTGVFVAPRDAVEQTVAGLWCEVFKLDRVGVEENFFDLGGHSLIAAQVHARLRRIFGGDLLLRDLFDAVTVEKLAALLHSRETQSGRTEKVAQAWLRLQSMTPEEKARLRARRAAAPTQADVRQ